MPTKARPKLPEHLIGFLVCEPGGVPYPVGLDLTPAPDILPLADNPERVYALCQDMTALRKEHVRALYLDSRHRLIRQETISIGTLTASLVHPREVFIPGLECSAYSLILVHCHPSGDPTPSSDDLALTRRLRQAGELLGIALFDHVIVGRAGYVSLKERGVT